MKTFVSMFEEHLPWGTEYTRLDGKRRCRLPPSRRWCDGTPNSRNRRRPHHQGVRSGHAHRPRDQEDHHGLILIEVQSLEDWFRPAHSPPSKGILTKVIFGVIQKPAKRREFFLHIIYSLMYSLMKKLLAASLVPRVAVLI